MSAAPPPPAARVTRRAFFASLRGRKEARAAAPAPEAALAPTVTGLVPAGEVFSLEAFYATRAADRAAPATAEPEEDRP